MPSSRRSKTQDYFMIKNLKINHFRNLTALNLELSDRLNCVVGDNGSGKTSLLEAIYFLSHARSFRSNRLQRLIQNDSPDFNLFAAVEIADNKHKIGLSRGRDGAAKLKLDDEMQPSHTQVAKLLPTLLFNPESFSQFWSGSKFRRSLFDWGLFYQCPEFLTQWQKLTRNLKQRNAALRQGQSFEMITLWDQAILELSAEIDQLRQNYVDAYIPIVEKLLSDFMVDQNLSIQYYRGWAKDRELADCLRDSIEQDRKMGYTHYGPQRADLRFRVGTAMAQDVLSRGQQKLLICCLKLAQGLLFTQTVGQPCIYLLDDLCSELDRINRDQLFSHLKDIDAQIFVTAIEPEMLSALSDEAPKIIAMESAVSATITSN